MAEMRCSKEITLLSMVFVIAMLLSILITSVEITVYKTPGWFQKEYEKYSVLEDVRGEMAMESALQVTDEMMRYLRGDRENLVVMTTLDSKKQEFFSQREKAHLADCRKLFLGGLRLRWLARITAVLVLLRIWVLTRKSWRYGINFTQKVPRVMGGAIFGLTVFAVLVARDFDQSFIRFHHIFFDNDKWLLNPKEDNLINLLPEGFFVDTAARILWIGLGLSALLCFCFFLANCWFRRKHPTESTQPQQPNASA